VSWSLAKCPEGGIHTTSVMAKTIKGIIRRDFPCIICRANAQTCCTNCGILCAKCRCTVFIDKPPENYATELAKRRAVQIDKIRHRRQRRNIKRRKKAKAETSRKKTKEIENGSWIGFLFSSKK
jgi:hypothetical protein